MHDRRIDGKAHTFGNQGTLYLSAMTWFDHETQSVWSQPIGTAIQGSYEGVRLEMIPATVVPWATWTQEHPDTVVLDTGVLQTPPKFDPFVGYGAGNRFIGVSLADRAKGYYFEFVSEKVAVNDNIGDIPILVYANPVDKSAHIYVRKVQGMVLEFEWVNGQLRDQQTGTVWDPTNGFGVEEPLRRKLLKELPYIITYGWAWVTHYPHTELYTR